MPASVRYSMLPQPSQMGAPSYSASTWYWAVGNRPGEIYSGPAGDYVPETDTAYQQWLTAGGVPTNVEFDGELADVLTNYNDPQPAMSVRNCGWTAWGEVPIERQFNVIVRAGCSIESTATPALNGVYAVDQNARTRQSTNVNYIQENSAFAPDNASTKDWPDVTGAIHTFPTTADFLNWVNGTNNWYSALSDWVADGGTGPLPTEPVVIP